MNNMGESCAGAKIERKHELDDIRVIEEASCHVKQHGEPVQSIDVNSSDSPVMPDDETLPCASTLSRDQIRANRKLRRQQKRDAKKLEKQKQGELKAYQDMIRHNRSDKIKLITEQDMMTYRRHQVEDDNECDDSNVVEKQGRENFVMKEELFPSLSETSNTADRSNGIPGKSSKVPKINYSSRNVNNVTSGDQAKFSNKFKTEPDYKLDTTNFPCLNPSEMSDIDRFKTSAKEKMTQMEDNVNRETRLSEAKDCAPNKMNNSKNNSDENATCDTKSNANTHLRNNQLMRHNCEAQTKKKLSSINANRNRRSNRPSYCINLLQTIQIQQKKKATRSKQISRSHKTPTSESYQNQGNPLDSSKPIIMNRGKHYMRNQVIAKNKKKTTRLKKIIKKYRRNKTSETFTKEIINNNILIKEFLDVLNVQLNTNFDVNGNFQKQILLFNFFTQKKNRNKIWDRMRACIQNMKDRLRSDETNAENNKVIEIGETIENQDNTEVLHVQKDDYEEHFVSSNSRDGKFANPELRDESKANAIISSAVENTANKKSNATAEPRNIAKTDETIENPGQITKPDPMINSRKLNRMEKKKQKKSVMNLDGTIVANKTRLDENVDKAEGRLDLNDIVERVVSKEDIEQLSSIKQQIHSRSFRPYCNQMPSPKLCQCSIQFLKQLVAFQERTYKSDPLKGQNKKRYIVGMKEIKKCLPIKSKVKLVFIAPDLECVPVSGGIEDEIQNLLSMATIQQIPYLFSIPRRTLGSITYKPPAMVEEILPMITEARRLYEERLKSLTFQPLFDK
ncbi:hypothetical protein M8J75_001010 [Diaphorina citri]|nr:hypothetical protein M8J75_001010 [Diaphorina citri]